MQPKVNASTMGLVANSVFGFILAIGRPIEGFDRYGFAVCSIVTTLVIYVQFILTVIVHVYFRKLHSDCWLEFE